MADLHKHLETHSSEPAYRCYIPDCSFTSRSLITMKLHQKKKHEVSRQEHLLQTTVTVVPANPGYCLVTVSTGGLCVSLQMPRLRQVLQQRQQPHRSPAQEAPVQMAFWTPEVQVRRTLTWHCGFYGKEELLSYQQPFRLKVASASAQHKS